MGNVKVLLKYFSVIDFKMIYITVKINGNDRIPIKEKGVKLLSLTLSIYAKRHVPSSS